MLFVRSFFTLFLSIELGTKHFPESGINMYSSASSPHQSPAPTVAHVRRNHRRCPANVAGTGKRTTTAPASVPAGVSASSVGHRHAAPQHEDEDLHSGSAGGRSGCQYATYGKTRIHRMTIGVAQSRRHGSVNSFFATPKTTRNSSPHSQRLAQKLSSW